MKMNILSFKPVNLFGIHDASACILNNGNLIGVEEERIIRFKHAIRVFPINAIDFCLKESKLTLNEIDEILIPYNPTDIRLNSPQNILNRLIFRPRKARRVIVNELSLHFGEFETPIRFMNHHLCHAASAFYPSGFEEAITLSIDGKGTKYSTTIWQCQENQLKLIKSFDETNSLGHLYGAFTEFLGFRSFNGEGKVMGLAPYGVPTYYETLCELMDPLKYDVKIFSHILDSDTLLRIERFLKVKRRLKDEPITQEHKNVAASIQKFLEVSVAHLVKESTELTGINNVCLSGGVALNCKMNKSIRELPEVNNMYVQPVAHDAGLSIGAILHRCKELDENSNVRMNVYIGPSYSDSQIESSLKETKLIYKKIINRANIGAKLIAQGKIIGWFQGKLEIGPRALGNRSILADPRLPDMSDKINYYVKHRESWRPFAPSILEESGKEYFENYQPSPYMIDSFEVFPEKQNDMISALHPFDRTARPQTVTKEQNPLYYQLIKEFYDITGVPIVINTSFNDKGEPIVNTPKEAIKFFLGSGMDALIIGNFLVEKNDVTTEVM